jgi:hypothetical protein
MIWANHKEWDDLYNEAAHYIKIPIKDGGITYSQYLQVVGSGTPSDAHQLLKKFSKKTI